MNIHVTVATVIFKKDRFLVIRESSPNRPNFEIVNQPAGHVEKGESLVGAAIRETLEETGWLCKIEHCIGIYHYLSPASKTQYVRTCFSAKLDEQKFTSPPDPAILKTEWISLADIQALHQRDLEAQQGVRKTLATQQGPLKPIDVHKQVCLRSPVVLNCALDYLSGQRIPWQCLSEAGLINSLSEQAHRSNLAIDQPAS